MSKTVGGKQGQLEHYLREAVEEFAHTQVGVEPSEIKVIVDNDFILVKLKGVMSPAEMSLVQDDGGKELLRQLNTRLYEGALPILSEKITAFTGKKVLDVQTGINVANGDLIKLFLLKETCDKEATACS